MRVFAVSYFVVFMMLFLWHGTDAFTVISKTAMRTPASSRLYEKTLEEEVEELVQADLKKRQRMSKLRNASGMEYAPWIKVSADEEAKLRQVMREKAEARRRRQRQEQNVQGSLLQDSTVQELSGTGLRYKIIDGDSVELEWATASERGTLGFAVKRRTAKTMENFDILADYRSFGGLASKGSGVYRYLDENIPPGEYFYRVTECESNGEENDLSQCLVEIQTPQQQMATKIALAGFLVIATGIVAAGLLLDPVQ
jgi:hypothetical protein